MSDKNAVIIGSLSQSKIFDKLEQELIIEGYNVRRPIKLDKPLFDIDKEWLDAISKADKIIAVPKPDGTFGESTTYEMAFASYLGKHIFVYVYFLDLEVGKTYE